MPLFLRLDSSLKCDDRRARPHQCCGPGVQFAAVPLGMHAQTQRVAAVRASPGPTRTTGSGNAPGAGRTTCLSSLYREPAPQAAIRTGRLAQQPQFQATTRARTTLAGAPRRNRGAQSRWRSRKKTVRVGAPRGRLARSWLDRSFGLRVAPRCCKAAVRPTARGAHLGPWSGTKAWCGSVRVVATVCSGSQTFTSFLVERAVFDLSAVVLPRPPPPLCAMCDVRKLQLLCQLCGLGLSPVSRVLLLSWNVL